MSLTRPGHLGDDRVGLIDQARQRRAQSRGPASSACWSASRSTDMICALQLADAAAHVLVVAAATAAATLLAKSKTAANRFELLDDVVELLLRVAATEWRPRVCCCSTLHLRVTRSAPSRRRRSPSPAAVQVARGVEPHAAIGIGDRESADRPSRSRRSSAHPGRSTFSVAL